MLEYHIWSYPYMLDFHICSSLNNICIYKYLYIQISLSWSDSRLNNICIYKYLWAGLSWKEDLWAGKKIPVYTNISELVWAGKKIPVYTNISELERTTFCKPKMPSIWARASLSWKEQPSVNLKCQASGRARVWAGKKIPVYTNISELVWAGLSWKEDTCMSKLPSIWARIWAGKKIGSTP